MPPKGSSPWQNLNRTLTDDEWLAFKLWRRANRHLSFRTGDMRADGKVFMGYSQQRIRGENWVTPAALDRQRAYFRKMNRRRAKTTYREQLNAKRRVERTNNPAHLAKRKLYRDAHRERINQLKRNAHRLRYFSDPAYREKHLNRSSDYGKKNRAYRNSALQKYRASLLAQRHSSLSEDAILAIYKAAADATRTTGRRWDVDHIIPLSRGGWHHELNMQILPHSVNRSKTNNPFWESDEYKTWRQVPEFLWPGSLAGFYRKILQREEAA